MSVLEEELKIYQAITIRNMLKRELHQNWDWCYIGWLYGLGKRNQPKGVKSMESLETLEDQIEQHITNVEHYESQLKIVEEAKRQTIEQLKSKTKMYDEKIALLDEVLRAYYKKIERLEDQIKCLENTK